MLSYVLCSKPLLSIFLFSFLFKTQIILQKFVEDFQIFLCIFFIGTITLVQVSTQSGEVFIFDIKTNPALMTQGRHKFHLFRGFDIAVAENISCHLG